jgi:hypothetical protein
LAAGRSGDSLGWRNLPIGFPFLLADHGTGDGTQMTEPECTSAEQTEDRLAFETTIAVTSAIPSEKPIFAKRAMPVDVTPVRA